MTAITNAGGVKQLNDILGGDIPKIPKVEMIEAIKGLIDNKLIYLPDYSDTIFYKEDDRNYSEIFALLPNYAQVMIWDKEEEDIDKGRYLITYEDLDYDTLLRILKKILEIKNL
jgi:hypothetical protein